MTTPDMHNSPIAALSSISFPVWCVNVYLKDADGNPTMTDGSPDMSFYVDSGLPWYGPVGTPGAMPALAGPGSATGVLGGSFLAAGKMFFNAFDWTSSFDWGSTPTPVSLDRVTVTQYGMSATDITPA